MRVRPLRRAEHRRMRWKNGGGWTTEIAVDPPGSGLDGEPFDWRLSLAEIDADGGFSRFDGCDRTLMLLDGPGLELRVDGVPHALTRRGQALDFDGASDVACRLLGGPCRDLNVMTRRGVVAHRAWLRPLLGPMAFFGEPEVTWIVLVAAGRARLQGDADAPELEAGDALLLEPGDGRRQAVIAGTGEVVLVRLARGAARASAESTTPLPPP